jgi:hypothetical protein
MHMPRLIKGEGGKSLGLLLRNLEQDRSTHPGEGSSRGLSSILGFKPDSRLGWMRDLMKEKIATEAKRLKVQRIGEREGESRRQRESERARDKERAREQETARARERARKPEELVPAHKRRV